jgi:hypothetical protein
MKRVVEVGKAEESQTAVPAKRQWRLPEIVNVGGVLDLTEAVGGNLNDSPNASMMVTYKN